MWLIYVIKAKLTTLVSSRTTCTTRQLIGAPHMAVDEVWLGGLCRATVSQLSCGCQRISCMFVVMKYCLLISVCPCSFHPLSTCKYTVSIFFPLNSQCDGSWWLPLTGLSWLPLMLSSNCTWLRQPYRHLTHGSL